MAIRVAQREDASTALYMHAAHVAKNNNGGNTPPPSTRNLHASHRIFAVMVAAQDMLHEQKKVEKGMCHHHKTHRAALHEQKAAAERSQGKTVLVCGAIGVFASLVGGGCLINGSHGGGQIGEGLSRATQQMQEWMNSSTRADMGLIEASLRLKEEDKDKTDITVRDIVEKNAKAERLAEAIMDAEKQISRSIHQ